MVQETICGANAAHTLAYSLVALQELNLAYKYPIIFWNTANLIVDSGSMNLSDKIIDIDYDVNEEELADDEDKKIENTSTNYGRIATAIGKMKKEGIAFALPDINKSGITFTPDVENNVIRYGIRGINHVGNQLIEDIFINRPYLSMEDFLSKIKVNVTQMTSLIKSGAFDSFYENRQAAMESYLNIIVDKKKRITLQNMPMLIKEKFIPKELDYERRLFNFNRYLKNFIKGKYYMIDTRAYKFFTERNSEDLLEDLIIDNNQVMAKIKQSDWDNIYQKGIEPIRKWIKENQQEILNNLNNLIYNQTYNKYAEGSISKWEMDSLSFYYHAHELATLDNDRYEIVDFFSLPEEPIIDKSFTTKDGKEIEMYKISRIAGTVIDKNKNKSFITLLTTTGVVTVKVWKNQFIKWDKQIAVRGEDGKNHVIEKSFFQRGTKLIITGIRRNEGFIPKKYKSTDKPLFERIDEIQDGIITKSCCERMEVDNE